MGQELADEYGIPFFQCSAKANVGVAPCFEAIAMDVKNRLVQSGGPVAPRRRLSGGKQQRGGREGGCCK